MALNTSPDRFGGARNPLQPGGVYVGKVIREHGDGTVTVFVKLLGSKIGPIKVANYTPSSVPNVGEQVLVSFLDNMLNDMVVIGRVTPRVDELSIADNLIVDSSTTDTLVRFTQRGTGDVLRVEDSVNPDSTPLIVTADGSVGIGLASPSKKLHVSGDAQITGDFTVGTSTLFFDVSEDSLGIGTTTPAAKLHVTGSTSGELVRLTQTGAGAALLVEDATNPDSTPFIIDASGNVGIGTLTPSTKVDISGSTAISGDLTVDTTTLKVDSTNNRVGIGTASPATALDVSGRVTASSAAVNTIQIGITSSAEIDTSSGNLTIDSAGGTVTIDDNLTVTGTLTTSLIPTGTIVPYAGSAEPSGWLFCNGQQVLSSSALGSILSTTYNTGGETAGNVRVPDLRGRTVVAADTMSAGGVTTAAGRVTSNNTLGSSSGSQTHTLTEAELRAHTHSINHDHAAKTSGAGSTHSHTANHGHGHTISASGGGSHAHSETNNIANSQASDYYVKRIGGAGSNWDFYSGATTRYDSAYYARTDTVGSTHSHTMSGTVTDATVNTGNESSHTHSVDLDAFTGTSGSTGSSSAHNNMQPYLVLMYIIKT